MRIRCLFSAADFLAAAAFAQINTADLIGTITDESGGIVRNVEVTLESQDTGAQRITHTNAAGRYNFEQLPPGLYRLTAQAAGFQTEVAPRVELTVGRKAVLDLRLKVGEVRTETVVTAGADLVDTRDSSLSNVMQNVCDSGTAAERARRQSTGVAGTRGRHDAPRGGFRIGAVQAGHQWEPAEPEQLFARRQRY